MIVIDVTAMAIEEWTLFFVMKVIMIVLNVMAMVMEVIDIDLGSKL